MKKERKTSAVLLSSALFGVVSNSVVGSAMQVDDGTVSQDGKVNYMDSEQTVDKGLLDAIPMKNIILFDLLLVCIDVVLLLKLFSAKSESGKAKVEMQGNDARGSGFDKNVTTEVRKPKGSAAITLKLLPNHHSKLVHPELDDKKDKMNKKDTKIDSNSVVPESTMKKASSVYIPDFEKNGITEVEDDDWLKHGDWYSDQVHEEFKRKNRGVWLGNLDLFKKAYKEDRDAFLAVLANFLRKDFIREENFAYIRPFFRFCGWRLSEDEGLSKKMLSLFIDLINKGEIAVDTNIEVTENTSDVSRLGANFDLCQITYVSKTAWYELANFCVNEYAFLDYLSRIEILDEEYIGRKQGFVPKVKDTGKKPKKMLDKAKILGKKIPAQKFLDLFHCKDSEIDILKTYYLMMFQGNKVNLKFFKDLDFGRRSQHNFDFCINLLKNNNFLKINESAVTEGEQNKLILSVTDVSDIAKWTLAALIMKDTSSFEFSFLEKMYKNYLDLKDEVSKTEISQDFLNILATDKKNGTVLGIKASKNNFEANAYEDLLCALQDIDPRKQHITQQDRHRLACSFKCLRLALNYFK